MEKMSLLRATMIQCRCERAEDLRHISVGQKRRVAADRERYRTGILDNVSLQECNDLLCYLVDAPPAADTETAYDKLITLLKAEQTYMDKASNDSTDIANADIFEELRNQLGCNFISDLKLAWRRKATAAYVAAMNRRALENYSLRQFDDLAIYLFDSTAHFTNYDEVSHYFREQSR